MRRETLLLILLFSMYTIGNAEVERHVFDSALLQDWDFNFELGHILGFNLDSSSYGMESDFTMEIKSVITNEANRDFVFDDSVNNTAVAGIIQIEDFEILISTGKRLAQDNLDYDIVPDISWGKITGALYIGPVIFTLTATDHDDNLQQGMLDNADLEFSNINYSVIPLHTTAAYNAQKELISSDVVAFDFKSTEKSGAVNGTLEEQDGGAISLEYGFEDVFEIKVGMSTQYSYTKIEDGDKYIPLSFTSLISFTPFESVSFNLFSEVLSGVNSRDVMEKDNPLIFGLSTGITFNLGPSIFITPRFGAEIGFMNVKAVDSNIDINGSPINPDKNISFFSAPFELTLSTTIDWRHLGLHQEEDNYLLFNNNIDDIVTDGISIATTFGVTQHDIFRELKVPYLGVKLAVWEYEYDWTNRDYKNEQVLKQGLVRNLQVAFISNVNYVFGGKIDDFHKYVSSDNIVSSKLELQPRLDIGLVLDMSYTYGFLRHKFGIIYKHFDYLQGKDLYKIDEVGNSNGRGFLNEADMRIKFGFDFLNLLPNTVFSLDWVSGDLYDVDGPNLVSYDKYDYFVTTDSANTISLPSNAKLGYLAIGFLLHMR